jgi:acetolactate synthase small subunit
LVSVNAAPASASGAACDGRHDRRQSLERELGLLKMKVSADGLAELRQRADNFGARILDDGPEHFTLERTGSNEKTTQARGSGL